MADSPRTIAALKQAVRHADIGIFDMYFSEHLRRAGDPRFIPCRNGPLKPHDQLLIEIVDSLLTGNFPDAPERNMFSEVLEAYKNNSPHTARYSYECRQALDLYIKSRS